MKNSTAVVKYAHQVSSRDVQPRAYRVIAIVEVKRATIVGKSLTIGTAGPRVSPGEGNIRMVWRAKVDVFVALFKKTQVLELFQN